MYSNLCYIMSIDNILYAYNRKIKSRKKKPLGRPRRSPAAMVTRGVSSGRPRVDVRCFNLYNISTVRRRVRDISCAK